MGPSHMAKHAAEFWFPECRECSCCQGFKYGCKCAASNGGSCTCSADDDAPTAVTTTTTIHSRQGQVDNANFHQQQRDYSSQSSVVVLVILVIFIIQVMDNNLRKNPRRKNSLCEHRESIIQSTS